MRHKECRMVNNISNAIISYAHAPTTIETSTHSTSDAANCAYRRDVQPTSVGLALDQNILPVEAETPLTMFLPNLLAVHVTTCQWVR